MARRCAGSRPRWRCRSGGDTDMADGESRPTLSYIDSSNNEPQLSPIASFSPSFTLNTEVTHSLEPSHVGVIYSPQSITFTTTVKATGDVAAQLTALALAGQR